MQLNFYGITSNFRTVELVLSPYRGKCPLTDLRCHGNTDLMRVEVDDHGSAHLVAHALEEVADAQRDVRVRTEAAAFLRVAVVEAAADVDGPATLHRQLTSLHAETSECVLKALVSRRTCRKGQR